jgi:Pectate lyase superfamily protein
MGSYVKGIYLPAAGETSWDDEVNANLSRLGDLAINVKAYGAVGDGANDDTAECQAAVNAWATVGGNLVFPPGTYLVSPPGIVLPAAPAGDTLSGIIWGYGAVIKATTAVTMMGHPVPASVGAAGITMNFRWTIQGFKFLGNNTTGQVGLDMYGTYGAAYRDMYFEQCDEGLRLTFNLMASVENCRGKVNKSYSFRARSGAGVIPGATTADSGSNGTVFRSCRDYGYSGQLAQFYIQASSGVELQNCITEGNNPVYAILHDDETTTVSKFFKVSGLHSENTPTGAVIRTKAMGIVIVEGVWHQTSCIMVDSTDSNAGAIIRVRDLPWTPATFKGAGNAWDFENMAGSYGQFNPNATSAWDGGVIPSGLYWHNRDGIGPNLQVRGNQAGGNVVFNLFADGDDTQPMYSFWGGAGQYILMGVGGSSAPDVSIRRDAADGNLATDNNFTLAGAGKYLEVKENGTTDAAAGAANTARLYCRDNGAGKTQLVVRFNTGAVQVIAEQA